jgi:hypothetical protein
VAILIPIGTEDCRRHHKTHDKRRGFSLPGTRYNDPFRDTGP